MANILINFFATTTIGLKDVCAEELREFMGIEATIDIGKVFFKSDLRDLYRVNFMSKTINRLFILILREKFSDLNIIYRLVKSMEYTEYIF